MLLLRDPLRTAEPLRRLLFTADFRTVREAVFPRAWGACLAGALRRAWGAFRAVALRCAWGAFREAVERLTVVDFRVVTVLLDARCGTGRRASVLRTVVVRLLRTVFPTGLVRTSRLLRFTVRVS